MHLFFLFNNFQSKRLVGSGVASLSDVIRFLVIILFPELSYKFKTRLFVEADLDYFVQFMLQRIDMRKTQNVRRNDFIDLLLDSVQENAI